MANLFDEANAVTIIPEEIVVGDFVQFKLTEYSSDKEKDQLIHDLDELFYAGDNVHVLYSGFEYGRQDHSEDCNMHEFRVFKNDGKLISFQASFVD